MSRAPAGHPGPARWLRLNGLPAGVGFPAGANWGTMVTLEA